MEEFDLSEGCKEFIMMIIFYLMWISFLPKDMPYLRAHYLHLYCGVELNTFSYLRTN